jgi:cysteine-rich repeat protein
MGGLAVRLRVLVLAGYVAAAGGCSVYHEPVVVASGPGMRDDPNESASNDPDAGQAQPTAPDNQPCARGRCWWSEQEPDACETSSVPSPSQRTRGDDDDDDAIRDLYLAWFHTQLGETAPAADGGELTWQQYGFDLDGTCTNAVTCRSEQDQLSCRGATARIPFDGELCRDNSFGSLHAIAAAIPEIGERFGMQQATVNCSLWRGDFSIVMRVSGYNGKPSDSQVRLDLYASTGLETLPPWACPLEDYDTIYPHWRQSTPWRIDSATLREEIATPGQLPDSTVHDGNAYVRDGYLVATFSDDVVLRFMGNLASYRGFAFTLHRSIWTGRLTRSQDSTWQISDGLIGGRIRKSDYVRAIREQGLCEGPLYSDLLGYIEESVDIVADADGSNREQSCDAISFAIGFDAAAMTPGAAATVPPLVECCPSERPLAECDADCGDGRITGTELCDTGIARDQDGACPTRCTSTDPCLPRTVSGADCMQECSDAPISEVGAADACCPSGANATVDEDCKAACGNGIVEAGETCDPPESCSACETTDKCLERTSTGAAESCNSRCTLTPKAECANGDECCPEGCNAMNDTDCSASCGDGTVDANELCERSGTPRCPDNCDDGDVCTQDVQTGSPEACNVHCTHLPITQPKSEDGCCPEGATANTDNDCAATCGNGKLEGEEQCDDGNVRAGDACSATCTQETPQERCAALWQPPTAECAQCGCEGCAPEIVACLAAADDRTRMLCSDVLNCAARSRCFGQECYCGDADPAACATMGNANGPCRAEIEQAANSTDPGLIRVISFDPTSPLGLAFTPRVCLDGLCRACTGNN